MQQHEARPTEYKGVVYKSKSEAIIARGFDLSIEYQKEELRKNEDVRPGVFAWEYEPEWLTLDLLDGYVPDFHIICVDDCTKSHSWFIEYKPKIPNSTYETYLCDKAFSLHVLHPSIGFILLVGSPFNEDGYRIYKYDYDENEFIDWYCNEPDYLFLYAKEAKKYRFDL